MEILFILLVPLIYIITHSYCFVFYNINYKNNSRALHSILNSSEATLRKENAINENPEIIDDKTDKTNNNSDITPSVCSTLKLSTVTISTKSILDRYRTNNKISVNDLIRGTHPVTTVIWDKLSPHSRDKSDTLKYAI